MNARSMVLGLLIITAEGACPAAPTETAADQITLRDGAVVKGLVVSATKGARGSVEFLVRRAWANSTVKQHLQAWERATASTTQLALQQRGNRLTSWRRERAPFVGPDDRIISWIDRELTRLSAPGGPEPSVLIKVRVPRTEVRQLDRRPAPVERLFRLGWICQLPEPESMSVDELKTALQTRGYAVDLTARNMPASLDPLLPPVAETHRRWLARRAATELAVDPDLRFVRFQDALFPDPGAGQPVGAMGLSSALSELRRLVENDAANEPDPLFDKLKAIGSRGRVGAAVTSLTIEPDLTSVTVVAALWIREGNRWFCFGSRTATVRPDDLGQEAGNDLAEDPQIKSVFQIGELLGLGSVTADLKQRSLRIGAATQKAIGIARADFNQDLDELTLPVLEPERDDPAGARRAPSPQP